ncbi:YybH family protein [Actinophytocola sp. NPDC049390]|uniref:YybH family protein n=1 Tax=Actinophytocola sp. NPDC049390 TaxID=3363894 RepID=UPI0037A4C48E
MPATEPAQLHDLFSAAVNAKDADALLALYEPAGTAVHLDGTTRTGEQALRAMIDELLSTIEHIDGRTRKVIVSGDIALTSVTWHARLSTGEEAGNTTAEVVRRQPDGTWRWVIDDPAF